MKKRGGTSSTRGLHHEEPVTVSLTANHGKSGLTGYRPFLERLADDDRFRKELLKDPDGMLASYGIRFEPPLKATLGSGKHELKLPPKAKVKELLASLSPSGVVVLMGHFFLVTDFWSVITTGGRSSARKR